MPGFVDSHDTVVRCNNYKLTDATGHRTDVFYSFFGASIHKNARELRNDGVTLCMCKCPDAHVIHSAWHIKRKMLNGVDFRYIYRDRARWWFCDTYIPAASEFMEIYNALGNHVPTTGFAAIVTIMGLNPKSIYLTGFDFFRSGIHNVDQPWRRKNVDDPISHDPERERAWLAEHRGDVKMTFDPALTRLMEFA